MFTYETEAQVIEAGERFERAQYWQRVKLIAEEAIEEWPDDEEARRECIEQDVDGDSYIIYTGKNLDVLRFTEHDDAYEEMGALSDIIPAGEGAFKVYQVVAYFAMQQDVQDEVQRLLDELEEAQAEEE